MERYVKFIHMKLDYAYYLWYIAEASESYAAYEQFFKFVTEPIKVKPDKSFYLYHNNVESSKRLLFYIPMALLNLGYLDEAQYTLEHSLNNLGKDDPKCLIFDGFSPFPKNSSNYHGLWYDYDWHDYDRHPKKNYADNRHIDIINELSQKHEQFQEKGISFFIGVAIAIKIETIKEMEKKITNLKQLFEAFANDDKDCIDKFKEEYPNLDNIKLFETDRIILGKEKNYFLCELEGQKKHLEKYVQKSSEWHPGFFHDLLDFDESNTSTFMKSWTLKELSRQSEMWASLRSTWKYFHRLFKQNESNATSVIQSTVKKLLEESRTTLKRKANQTISSSSSQKLGNSQLNGMKVLNMKCESLFTIPPLFQGEDLVGPVLISPFNYLHFFKTSQNRIVEVRRKGIKCKTPLNGVEIRPSQNILQFSSQKDNDVSIGKITRDGRGHSNQNRNEIQVTSTSSDPNQDFVFDSDTQHECKRIKMEIKEKSSTSGLKNVH